MMDGEVTVGYYCAKCKKSVECHVAAWIEMVVSLIPPHRVKVEIRAQCPNCGAFLASGMEVIELY